MESLLKKHFGYDKFRPMQLEIIENVLAKKDSLVLMPTGGGKSLCFQIPALQLPGLTVVISPLISLMKDQVDSLKANGVGAEYINSTLLPREIEAIKDRIVSKDVKLLYVAPERLASEEFKIFLMTVEVSLIAIDEAHCISEWGHDFRKDYRNLKFLKKMFPGVPLIALTATATLKVREDIIKQLGLVDHKVFISSFNRENLKLRVVSKKKSIDKILTLLKEHKGESVIIYCFSRKETENCASRLNDEGFKALPYHAGLTKKIRKKNQELFIEDKVNIMVATVAFGMGIDKPDVRLVVHHTFSKSLEGYYQEIGRAGRDGLPSECVLFYSYGDKWKHDFFIGKIWDDTVKESAERKLSQMISYCDSDSCRRKGVLAYFGESFEKPNCGGCDVCLNLPDIPLPTDKEKGWVEEREKPSISYAIGLFGKLKALRKKIAEERNVPPFIIFGDVSLREMCMRLPKDKAEFLKVSGVGQKKLDDFGEAFLEVISAHVKETGAVKGEEVSGEEGVIPEKKAPRKYKWPKKKKFSKYRRYKKRK